MNNWLRNLSMELSFPPGYRFWPTEAELITYYLARKILKLSLPPIIIECNIYEYNPNRLSEKFKPRGINEWYFFTPRNKKYKNGKRPDRAAGDGFWKATGSDKKVYCKGRFVGWKRTLGFHVGKPPSGQKTNWLMHEFRVPDAPARPRNNNKDKDEDMKLDWVLCKIYPTRRQPEEQNSSDIEQEMAIDNSNAGATVVASSSNTNSEHAAYSGAYSDYSSLSYGKIEITNHNYFSSSSRGTLEATLAKVKSVAIDGAYFDNSNGDFMSMQQPNNNYDHQVSIEEERKPNLMHIEQAMAIDNNNVDTLGPTGAYSGSFTSYGNYFSSSHGTQEASCSYTANLDSTRGMNAAINGVNWNGNNLSRAANDHLQQESLGAISSTHLEPDDFTIDELLNIDIDIEDLKPDDWEAIYRL